MLDEYDFIAPPNYSKELIDKTQKVLLIMAKKIHEIFDAHNIRYFITFGTLLGAVRHKGFVPWDNDFDMFLLEDDYEDALYWLKKELPEWMIVHNEENDTIYWPYWSRVRDLNSEVETGDIYADDKYYKYKGISVDLYKLKKCRRDEVDLSVYRENCHFYKKKYEAGMLSQEIYNEKMKDLEQKIQTEETKPRLADCDDVYYFVFLVKMIESRDIFPLKKYEFAGTEFWGPNNADAILKQAYGEYMKVPPIEKRKPHGESIKFFDSMFEYE